MARYNLILVYSLLGVGILTEVVSRACIVVLFERCIQSGVNSNLKVNKAGKLLAFLSKCIIIGLDTGLVGSRKKHQC